MESIEDRIKRLNNQITKNEIIKSQNAEIIKRAKEQLLSILSRADEDTKSLIGQLNPKLVDKDFIESMHTLSSKELHTLAQEIRDVVESCLSLAEGEINER
ncbi:hypothetical protein [Clostridium paraputrificum]|uniref:Uncharacterized protein n=1 Tax=Clostridium paraputrificum TaxID=29363 RepID=A0A6N3EUY5_9CLOT